MSRFYWSEQTSTNSTRFNLWPPSRHLSTPAWCWNSQSSTSPVVPPPPQKTLRPVLKPAPLLSQTPATHLHSLSRRTLAVSWSLTLILQTPLAGKLSLTGWSKLQLWQLYTQSQLISTNLYLPLPTSCSLSWASCLLAFDISRQLRILSLHTSWQCIIQQLGEFVSRITNQPTTVPS